jgi:hypothetical protein
MKTKIIFLFSLYQLNLLFSQITTNRGLGQVRNDPAP